MEVPVFSIKEDFVFVGITPSSRLPLFYLITTFKNDRTGNFRVSDEHCSVQNGERYDGNYTCSANVDDFHTVSHTTVENSDEITAKHTIRERRVELVGREIRIPV
jgi:hypothetical protein